MRTLYHLALSPFSRKVRVALREKGLEFQLRIEKVWERRAEFLAMILVVVYVGAVAVLFLLDRKSTRLNSSHRT